MEAMGLWATLQFRRSLSIHLSIYSPTPSFLLSSAIDHLSFPHSLYLSYIYVCVNIFKEEKLVGLNKFDHSKCSFVLYLWCQGILYELINRSLVRCTLKDSKDILGLQELLM